MVNEVASRKVYPMFSEPPVPDNRFADPDIHRARCAAHDHEAYFAFVQRIWHRHQLEASRQSAAIVRRVMNQHRNAA